MAEAISRTTDLTPTRRRVLLGFEAGAAFLARGPAPLPVISRAGDTPDALRGGVVLLGNFDGFHKGHQALLAHGKAVAERSVSPLGVMSVEPHPRQFFGRNAGPFRLTSPGIKLVILREQGFDFVYAPAFDARFAAMTAEAFVEQVLVEVCKSVMSSSVTISDSATDARARRTCWSGSADAMASASPAWRLKGPTRPSIPPTSFAN